MAILTGGKVVTEELGIKLEGLALADLGQAKRVLVRREDTTIIGGAGSRPTVEGRCRELRKQIADSTSDYDKEKLEERLAGSPAGWESSGSAPPRRPN